MGNLDDLKMEILRTKIEFVKSVSNINGEDNKPYFNDKCLLENMLGFKNIYCPGCLKTCTEYNAKTFAPECSCGWTGNMLDLLIEKDMNKELRRRKIENINKLEKEK